MLIKELMDQHKRFKNLLKFAREFIIDARGNWETGLGNWLLKEIEKELKDESI